MGAAPSRDNVPAMNTIIPFVIFASLGAVVVVLILGLVNLARGGSSARSKRLMQWRVALQFVAIGVLLIAVLISRGHG